jgi:glyoxylase-like metal-dependent hydrolase (beta-lactamase superfamily II)
MISVDSGYRIDILVQGYPGKSVCHGGLGWSTVALLRGHDRVALIDAGTFGMRHMLVERLRSHGLEPEDVTDLLLSHSHYDHSVNWPLFRDARIHIGKTEIDWSLGEPWGRTPVPEIYMEKLADWPTLATVEPGDEVIPNIRAHVAPGHTPGSLVYVLDGSEADVVFTGDAAKNRAEMISRTVGPCHDRHASGESIDLIWSLWRRRTGSVLVPGHDLPMVLENGETRYLGEREAVIQAWFEDDLEQVTLFELGGSGAGNANARQERGG